VGNTKDYIGLVDDGKTIKLHLGDHKVLQVDWPSVRRGDQVTIRFDQRTPSLEFFLVTEISNHPDREHDIYSYQVDVDRAYAQLFFETNYDELSFMVTFATDLELSIVTTDDMNLLGAPETPSSAKTGPEVPAGRTEVEFCDETDSELDLDSDDSAAY